MHYLLTVFPSLLPISPTENNNEASPQNKPRACGYVAVGGVGTSNESRKTGVVLRKISVRLALTNFMPKSWRKILAYKIRTFH